jgi:predicted nucleic acid-binding protein
MRPSRNSIGSTKTCGGEARFLDTTRYTDISRGAPDVIALVEHAEAVQLRRQGTPIPTNDLWIASLVLQHDLVLCARDRHFDHLPQITRA